MLLATAAVVPLVAYGGVSIYSLREGTRRSVTGGNLNVARSAAAQIHRYVTTNIQIFQSLAAVLQNTNLAAQQQDRILKNYVLRFPEFRELTLFDAHRRVVASSRIGAPTVRVPDAPSLSIGGTSMSPIDVDDDLLPTTVLTVPLQQANTPAGWLVGAFSLEEMWRAVDRIRVGSQGFALIVGPRGELLAHGNPDEKPRVARGDNLSTHEVLRELRDHRDRESIVKEIRDPEQGRTLVVGVRLDQLDWLLLVDQPVSEAYAVATQIERQLIATIALALFIMVSLGYGWGRSLINPIAALIRATQAISEGRLDARVPVKGKDEIGQLGDAFNSMADRLVTLQEDLKKKERLAMFGRIAAGLVHDLSHPIQNIGNSCKLILKMPEDRDYRETFRRTVDRELASIKRVFEDLRNIARPIPLEYFPVEINKSISDIVEAMRPSAKHAMLELDAMLPNEALYINGDLFALGRVFRNLLLNAFQATAPRGRVSISTGLDGEQVRITISDTGCGIPPERLATVFEDFVTTKRQGLGLGLAIARKIVEQLGGTISAESEVNKGTTFVLRFPAITAPPVEAAGPIAV